MSLSNIKCLEAYTNRFAPTIPYTPAGRYASIILLRETKSYAIFTTEGGEQQDVEQTQAGLTRPERADRLVMFKRKQVAPERRTGKALLRQYGAFPYAILYRDGQVTDVVYGAEAVAEAQEQAKGDKKLKVSAYDDCYLTAGLCTHCPDCLTYGYAAIEAEGSRKSRVMTDSCFSIRPYPLIQKMVKFNVIDEKTQTSGTITEYDYTLPEVFLPAVETTVDLTADELVYVLGNILRTPRYGKESSRQGFVRNRVLAVAFSDVELFANLEFTQALYDALVEDEAVDLSTGFLSLQDCLRHAREALEKLTADLAGRLEMITGGELTTLLDQVRALNRDEVRLATFLRELNQQSASFVV